jgi:Zn-dependent protease/predicted transcriptional regulator
MFGRQLKLFTLLGFDIKVDFSWVFLAILVTWSLATGYFPTVLEGFDAQTYWVMGATGAVGLFVSIVFHELSHSVVARAFGMKIKGITLFIFGGVAELEDEPPSALAEFLVAIAGPIASLFLAWISFRVVDIENPGDAPLTSPALGVLGYLGFINLVLAIFNMLPAFPLDGGRAFRAILWGFSGSMRRATMIAARVGSFFGMIFIFLGLYSVIFTGNIIGGLWWALIGLFLRGAAGSAVSAEVTKKTMQGEVVARFMVRDPVTVLPQTSAQDFIDDFLYHYFHDVYPVTNEDGTALGVLHTKDVQRVASRDLATTRVEEIMELLSAENMIAPNLDAIRAVNLMNKTGNSRLLVVEYGKLVGIVTLRDMLRLLELKMDLDPRNG